MRSPRLLLACACVLLSAGCRQGVTEPTPPPSAAVLAAPRAAAAATATAVYAEPAGTTVVLPEPGGYTTSTGLFGSGARIPEPAQVSTF